MTLRPPVWVAELAARFWAAAGPAPPFPRDLTDPVTWGTPLAVHLVPNLSLARAADWLARCSLPVPTSNPDRPLRGCLAVAHGGGFILIEATDDPDERRFTLAHELAHFLRDYDHPRRLAAARLGPSVLDVLDGRRPPTPEERLAAVLRHVTIGCHVHLLDRDASGRPASAAERDSEDAADRLAFELLAPFDAVTADPVPTGRDHLTRRLAGEFGLPPGPAAAYAAAI